MVGRRSRWVVIAAWLIAALVAIPFQSKLQVLASDESDAFKDRGAESTRADDGDRHPLPRRGRDDRRAPLHRDGPLTPPDAERIAADASAVCRQVADIVRVITRQPAGLASCRR